MQRINFVTEPENVSSVTLQADSITNDKLFRSEVQSQTREQNRLSSVTRETVTLRGRKKPNLLRLIALRVPGVNDLSNQYRLISITTLHLAHLVRYRGTEAVLWSTAAHGGFSSQSGRDPTQLRPTCKWHQRLHKVSI